MNPKTYIYGDLKGHIMKRQLYNIAQSLYNYIYVSPMLSVTSRYPIGTNVYEKDWDVLILLDTCRVDALQEVSNEYNFLPKNIGQLQSVGSHSREWMANTFTEKYTEEISGTAYITANANAEYTLEEQEPPEEFAGVPAWTNWKTVSADSFLHIDHVWMHGDHIGHVIPNIVTDRAISVARDKEPDRLIVHYSQPHEPYAARVRRGKNDELEPWEKSPFDYLINGGDINKVWESYIDNLRYVLDSVEVLVDNITGPKTVISADHGEAFGEWGFYAHQFMTLVPEVRYVPWAETTATDEKTYEPSFNPSTTASQTAEEQLKALGYK